MFLVVLFLGIGVQIEFFQLVLRDIHANGLRGVNFVAMPLYWLLWNILPFTLFAIGRLLKKQGR